MSHFATQLAAAQRQYESLSPDDDGGGMLEDPASAAEYIRECCGDAFFDKCDDMVQGWLQGPQDSFAKERLLREARSIAEWYAKECNDEDERRNAWRPEE